MNKCCTDNCRQGRDCHDRHGTVTGWDAAVLWVAVLGSAAVLGVWFFGGAA